MLFSFLEYRKYWFYESVFYVPCIGILNVFRTCRKWCLFYCFCTYNVILIHFGWHQDFSVYSKEYFQTGLTFRTYLFSVFESCTMQFGFNYSESSIFHFSKNFLTSWISWTNNLIFVIVIMTFWWVLSIVWNFDWFWQFYEIQALFFFQKLLRLVSLFLLFLALYFSLSFLQFNLCIYFSQ